MYYIGSLLVDVLSSIMLKQEFFKKISCIGLFIEKYFIVLQLEISSGD